MKSDHQVLLGKKVEQDLNNLPLQIIIKFRGWIEYVELYGIQQARLIKGFHDEPLKGQRKGQRSIRLNRAYRAIYIELQNNEIQIIKVIEVHKHDY
jgi:proteic killer suppression protein